MLIGLLVFGLVIPIVFFVSGFFGLFLLFVFFFVFSLFLFFWHVFSFCFLLFFFNLFGDFQSLLASACHKSRGRNKMGAKMAVQASR